MPTNTVVSQRNQEPRREITTIPEKPFLNLSYKYTSDDVDQSMQAMLKWKNYHFAEKCNYLLEKTYEEHKNTFLVALTPPVDQESLHSTAIDYFLNKTKQCISDAHVLTNKLNHDTLATLQALPNNEEQIHLLKETLQSSIGAKSDNIYPTLLAHLQAHEFNRERLKEAYDKAWDDLHDVFDEVMPSLLNKPGLAVKILFPYLSGERLNNIDGHWLTGEIQIRRKSNHYQIEMTAHDPFGGGQIKPDIANDLQASIAKRMAECIAKIHPAEKPTFTFAAIQSTYFSCRQLDKVSCGVIAVEELMKRLEGHSLDGVQYKKGCTDLRTLQYDNRWKYSKSDLNHLKTAPSSVKEKTASLSPSHLKNGDQETRRALHFLDIDEAELERITDNDARWNKIHYKRLVRELIYSSICRTYAMDEASMLRALDIMEAHLMITKTQNVENQQPQENQQQSVGLKDLKLRGNYQKSNRNRRGSVMELGKKPVGVEPGFFASLVEDQVAYLERCFPERQARLDYFYNQCSGDLAKLYHDNAQELPKYLVKMDYTLISEGRVAPERENLKRTHVIQRAYQVHPLWGSLCVEAFRFYKIGSPLEKNRDAVLEALANDLARASGMNVQEQTLLPGIYENGDLKLLLKGKWLNNATTLGPLKGGSNQFPYHNYRAKKTDLRQPAGICYIANHSIADLASHFATLLVQGDYDGIGEEGGNKLEINQQLFGIDFGHAYRGENQIIQHLLPNWHLPVKLLSRYKNFSIFHDSRRSELAQGMLIYAKLAGRDTNDSALHHDVAFRERLEDIESNAIEKLIDDYINRFQNLAEKEPHHKAHYLAIVEAVKGTKKRVLDAIKKLLDKLGDNIYLPPQLLDCLDHLEKISLGKEGTSLRSPDGTVALQHLRVVDEEQLIPWSVVENDDRYRFSAKVSNSKRAEKVADFLRLFLTQQRTFQMENGTITFSVMKDEFQKFAAEIAEDIIKQRFHQDDYTHYQELVQEQAIIDFTCHWKKEVDAYSLTFALEDEADKSYVLTLEKKDKGIYTAEEAATLTRLLPKGTFIEDMFVIYLSSQDLNESLEGLTQLKNSLPKKNVIRPNLPYQPKKRRDMEDEELKEKVPQEIEKMEGIELDVMKHHLINDPHKGFLSVLAIIRNGDLLGLQAYLLTHHVDEPVDKMGNTLLHYALSENQPILVRYLLETAKANPLIKNKEEKPITPIGLAINYRKTDHYLQLALKRINESAYDYKEPPLQLSQQETLAAHTNPDKLLQALEDRRLEREKEIMNPAILKQFISELEKLFEYGFKVFKETQADKKSHLSKEAQPSFIDFWKELCSIQQDSPLFGDSEFKKLQTYHQKYTNKSTELRARISYSNKVKDGLSSNQDEVQKWALKEVGKLAPAKSTENSESRDLVVAQKQINSHLVTLNKTYNDHMIKERQYRQAEFNRQKEKREIWKEDKKARLQAQWTYWVKKAAIANPNSLAVDVVFHILSSRILLIASDSLCEDDQFDRLLFHCATQSQNETMKTYWGPILQGLVVLGANPEKIFQKLLHQDDKTNHQDLSIAIVYALGISSGFMLTHLQQRAKYLENCIIEMEKTLESLAGAASNFGNQLHEAVYDPGFLRRLFSNNRNPQDGREERARLLAALMQIIQLLFNDDLQVDPIAKDKLLDPKEVDKQLQLNKDKRSLLDKARKKYYEIEKQCDNLILEAGKIVGWYRELGKKEFDAIKTVMGELENILTKLSENRQREINALSLMQAKIKINQSENTARKEHEGRVQAEKKVEEVTIAARQAMEKAEQEAAARKEAETQAEKAKETAEKEATARKEA
ncbi:cell envelope integrity protein TolA, partial [Legionella fairfieldensis]|uniref:cell envelope integrity protein TolA n=2 Tax=Legionella fairfieldensis TaxID=45064 RepID=UPI001A94DD7E